jgi:uncharacterized membrane protein
MIADNKPAARIFRPATAALVISLAVAVGTGFDLSYPGRAVVTVLFALVVPGWVAVSYVRFRERLVEIIAAVSLSIALGILIAMTQVLIHAWHPRFVVAGWALATAVAAVPLVRRRTVVSAR